MMGDWTLFSNHGHVLVCLARKNDARLRDVAVQVGITERAVQKIVKDLQEAGFIEVRKQGRCNRYRINRRKSLRHALESHCTVGKLLNLIAPPGRVGRLVVEPEFPSHSEPELQPEPGFVSEPEAEPELQPESELESELQPEPEPETEPETETQHDSESNEQPASKGTAKKESPDGPVDVRQQGSLF